MNYIIQILFCCFFISNGYGQGGWDISYKPIQKNIDSLIGKEVRIDFRQTPSDTITRKNLFVRKLLHIKDSVKLNISGKSILFREVWKIYRDMGFVSYQYLESFHPKMKLKNMTLEKISKDSITFKTLLISDKGNKTIKLIIEKKKIKGFLFKRKK